MSACIDVIPGCSVSGPMYASAPMPGSSPSCDTCDSICRTYLQMKLDDPSFHQKLHTPIACRHCGSILDDRKGCSRTRVNTCANGLCHVWFCPDCGGERGRDGLPVCPIGCPPLRTWVTR